MNPFNAFSKYQNSYFTCLFSLFLFFFKLFVCWWGFRPTREFFTYLDTSSLPVIGCKFWPLLGTYGHRVVRALAWTRDTHTFWQAFGSRAFLPTSVSAYCYCRGLDSNNQPSDCGANALTDCTTAEGLFNRFKSLVYILIDGVYLEWGTVMGIVLVYVGQHISQNIYIVLTDNVRSYERQTVEMCFFAFLCLCAPERTWLYRKNLHKETKTYYTQTAWWMLRVLEDDLINVDSSHSCLVVELSLTVLTKYFCCNWYSKFHRVRASAPPNETPWQFRFLCDFRKRECPLF